MSKALQHWKVCMAVAVGAQLGWQHWVTWTLIGTYAVVGLLWVAFPGD